MNKFLNIILAVFMVAHCVHAGDKIHSKKNTTQAQGEKKWSKQFDTLAAQALYEQLFTAYGAALQGVKETSYREAVGAAPDAYIFKYDEGEHSTFEIELSKNSRSVSSVRSLEDVLPVVANAVTANKKNPSLPVIDEINSRSARVSLLQLSEKKILASLFFTAPDWPELMSNPEHLKFLGEQTKPYESKKKYYSFSPELRAAFLRQGVASFKGMDEKDIEAVQMLRALKVKKDADDGKED